MLCEVNKFIVNVFYLNIIYCGIKTKTTQTIGSYRVYFLRFYIFLFAPSSSRASLKSQEMM